MSVALGKYQLLRKIASGGMGQVFLAMERQGGIERLVVLKLVLPHLSEDEEFLEMFQEEAQLVARLRHPNLITILEWTQLEGRHCLTMEYVQGDDVRRLDKFARAQGRPLPVGLALRLVAEAAAGLHYAHQARDPQGRPLHLVHRDVSPQNILVGFDGGVKVIDFGVAKAAGSSSNTATGVLKGKYPYMSPEQANGQTVDARSDLFALGVVLWELVTGKRLFKGESDLMTLRLVRDCQVPPPSQINSRLPPGLDALVLKALAPEPRARYTDCGAFRLAIEDYILQYRLPASNAHLSAWLRELYAERIAHEADPTHLDQLHKESDLEAKSNPSQRSSVRSLSQKPVPEERTASRRLAVVPATQHTLTVAPQVEPGRFPLRTAVASLGALLMAAGVAIIILRRQPLPPGPVAPPVQGQVEARPVEPRPVEPSVPAHAPEPTPVRLTVRSEPTGARVEVDGRQQGETPVDVPLPPDASPVTLALKLEGYEPISRRISAGDAPEVSVRLQPKAVTQKPPRRPAPPLDIKMGR